MPQTADFLYSVNAALAGQFVSLVSNKDGVTKFAATVASNLNGQWTINPKPPAGTYTLYSGASQGALTTLVDPDYVVDQFDDSQNSFLPGYLVVGNAIGNAPFAPSVGDAIVNRGGASPGTGAVYFGSSAGLHNLLYDGAKFQITDGLQVNAGLLTLLAAPGVIAMQGAGTAAIIWGTTGGQLSNNANNAANMSWTDAGVFTIRAGLTITAGGFTVSAGGFTVTGNSTLTGTLGGLTGLTVASGGIIVTAGGITVNAGPIVGVGGIQVPPAASFDTNAAGQLQIGATNASTIAMRGPQKSLVVGKALTSLAAGAQTLTAANLIGGDIEHTVTAAVADTTDTGTNLDAAVPNAAVGDTIECYLTILGAFTVTLTAGVGVTIKGTTALLGTAAGKTAHLVFRRTGAAAWTCYVVFST